MPKLDPPITLDYETAAIQRRPHYPPVPAGVSIYDPLHMRAPTYWAWGHDSTNNCTREDAQRVLKSIYASGRQLLFHNGAFDLDVGETHLDLALPPWHQVEDTMFLLFLDNPHAKDLKLKPSAQRLLGMAPTEQEVLRDWLVANIPGVKQSNWAEHIPEAPGDLTGAYAKGDTLRTYKLWQRLKPEVVKQGMGVAYDRERRLLPHLLRNSRQGLRVDVHRLEREIPLYQECQRKAERWLFKRLNTQPFNLDSNDELAQVLLRCGAADENLMLRTAPSSRFPQGQLSVGKESLQLGLTDARVAQVLGYRNRLTTCLRTFMEPWLELALNGSGRIHTHWRQVRSGGGSDETGARTGRLIGAEPNLLNLAKSFEDRDDGYEHPAFIPGLLPLPLVRTYILPEPGHVFGHRDYDQQEFRLLAHFEDGKLCRAYADDPTLDVHVFVGGEIKRIRGIDVGRRVVKTTNFGMLYGMGLKKLAAKMKIMADEARALRDAQRQALPDVFDKDGGLDAGIKERARNDEPIRTWGGRLYYCEPPRIIDNHTQTFEYKLLNYLVQGSAADVTKEAVIRYCEHPKRREGKFLVTVYDEANASLPKKRLKEEMDVLRDSMEGIEGIEVYMKSSAKIGPNWGELSKYEH